MKHLYAILLTTTMLSLVLFAIGCGDEEPAPSGDTDTETATETDEPSDTGMPQGCPAEFDLDVNETSWDYTEAYGADSLGYGFQGSACWSNVGGVSIYNWVPGETIHDICLNDDMDNEVCLHDYYQTTEYDLIFVDVSAKWCSPCRAAATGEGRFLEIMEENGWKVQWITILADGGDGSEPVAPTKETAKFWKYLDWTPLYETYGQYLHGPVLYDANMDWGDLALGDTWPFDYQQRGFPTIFMVHPSNMRIWDVLAGFAPPSDPEVFEQFITASIVKNLNKYKDEEGACTTPPCNPVGMLSVDTDI